MIKKTELSKERRRLVILIGFACLTLLSYILLTNAVTNKEIINKIIGAYNTEELLQYRTEFVGDNVKVVNIIKNLPYGDNAAVSLQTSKKPYGVAVNYDFKNNEVNQQQLEEQFYDNAAVAFALIQNVDEVLIKLADSGSFRTYTRQEISQNMNVDLWSCSQNKETFEKFLQDLAFKVHVSPMKYALTMSSTPGINLIAVYQGDNVIKTVRYTTETGGFSTWGAPAGKVVQEGRSVELPYGKGVYWSPLFKGNSAEQSEENTVTVTLLDKDRKEISSRQIKIMRKEYSYEVLRSPGVLMEINPAPQESMTIEDAVRSIILAKASSYKNGEAATEGHVILSEKEMGSMTKIYTIVSIGNFGFENGVFTKISGSGAIPTVITLDNREESKFSLLEYKEPQDGSGYTKSIKEMFPLDLQKDALDANKYYPELSKQQELQAGEYLRSIGRTARISEKYVEKTLVNINAVASNKLFAGIGKYDSIVNKCPYWIGTVEEVTEGIRYIYQTSLGKTNDGYDIVTFTQTKEDGTIVKQVKYKIIGSEVQQIE